MSKKKPAKFPSQEQKRQPGIQSVMDPQPQTAPRTASRACLKGKNAIITGGDSGIGRSVAEHFAAEGANVAIVYKDEHDDAEAAQNAVLQYDVRCELFSGDIADRDFCKHVVRKTVDQLGSLDILVCNASEQHVISEPEKDPDELIEQTFQSNILGTIRLCYSALPVLKEHARIIITSSVVAYRGNQQLLDYAGTKGAQISFMRSLAARLAERKILVNAVAPGPIWTPLIPASFPAEKVEQFGRQVPLGRAGQPNEVAPAFVFLACSDGDYITGQTIHVNGGVPTGS